MRSRLAAGTARTGLLLAAAVVALSGQLPAAAAGPPVPAAARFVAAAQLQAAASRASTACPRPDRPGQMTCMALLPGNDRGTTPASSPPAGAYGPSVLQADYDLAAAAAITPATPPTVAIVDAYNDPHAASDLAVYRSQYGLGGCTTASGCLRIVNQAGGSALPAADSTGSWELEESLDLDTISAVCPHCHILLIEARSDSVTDLAVAERYAVRHADVVGDSWGSGSEFTGESSFDKDFYRPGVAIAAASGDFGYGTQYPAASPYVTSVGGTELTGTGPQAAWPGTGSGCSSLEPAPSWQVGYQGLPDGCLNRTENDVSADADPDPGQGGVAIYDTVRDSEFGGAPDWATVGGTSLSAQIIAGSYALADIAAGGHGLVPHTMPASYPYLHASDFNDSISGSNGSCEADRRYLCHAVTGYDGPTGLGSPAGPDGLAGPTGPTVTVLDPGARVYRGGTPVRLAVTALATTGKPAFAATGLPAGLRISRSGLLTGRLHRAVRGHAYRVTLTASAGGATGSATFSLLVVPKLTDRHPAEGAMRLDGGGRCLATGLSLAHPLLAAVGSCAVSRWSYVTDGNPAGAGLLRHDGGCLASAGAAAVLSSCTGSAAQRWAYQAGDQLRNVKTGRCLASAGDGSPAALRRCTGGPAQSWQLPAGPVLSALAGQCLAVAGPRVTLAGCRPAASQHWLVSRSGRLQSDGKCLVVAGRSMLDGAAIKLAACSAAAAQRWLPGPHGELINENSGRCLTAGQAGRLTQQDCYSLQGQIWAVT